MSSNHSSISEILLSYDLNSLQRSGFLDLYNEFIINKNKSTMSSSIGSLVDENITKLIDLPSPLMSQRKKLLSRLVVVKLNGGLGTSMGCLNAKSSIKVKGDDSFLDLTLEQISSLNKQYETNIKFALMNSFYTHHQSVNITKNYSLPIVHFQQDKYPRINAKSLLPLDLNKFADHAYYPPGHGNIFSALLQNDLAKNLIKSGQDYMFISNSDNLSASIDFRILSWIIKNKISFLMEVTPQTISDKKGGVLVKNLAGKIALAEISQLSSPFLDKFTKPQQCLPFNTNNIWIHLPSLINLQAKGNLNLPIIVNKKTIQGEDIIQLETAMGSAISCFDSAKLLLVDKSRFLPVKSCDDLFLIQSNLFTLKNGYLINNQQRKSDQLPLIQLGKYFYNIKDYQKRLPTIPNILDLESLSITGNVWFSSNITLKGRVKIIAKDKPIIIPSGSLLADQSISFC
ncbi:MAG: UTP--glucose-1-phosphate uridylyltransferase [SAR324 cluster bacterium]|nr:UTP--glucose-1-phosphate uridylyltransferase [SAR324 cluster bacterium]